jgi:hypothetical protein
MTKHRLVRQTGPQLDESTWPRFGLSDVDGIVIVRTNASAAHFYAVEMGLGIGALASYAVPLGADLIPVDMGFRHHIDIWMTYNPDVKSVRRVAMFIEWIRSLFDTKKYPWFKDEFIHPNDLPKAYTPARLDVAKARPLVTHAPDLEPYFSTAKLKAG